MEATVGMVKIAMREVIAAIAGPRSWLSNETREHMFWRVGEETGYKAKTISKLWSGEYESKRAAETLRAIARQKDALARAAATAPDHKMADEFASQSRRFDSLVAGG